MTRVKAVLNAASEPYPTEAATRATKLPFWRHHWIMDDPPEASASCASSREVPRSNFTEG
ncbi:hypothetical protein FHT76_008323 [Rhizobium sp. BK176]|jgi:hypothetical protein|nr:hypothetical protein [Rhizobium sp. BK399]MCS3740202.1 hypothetical protein [Rhizobium sp. BK661]MCS4096601.1 hypothetical protein [Rhizobium sp. BK176]